MRHDLRRPRDLHFAGDVLLILLSTHVRDETSERRWIPPIHRRIAPRGDRQIRIEKQAGENEGNDIAHAHASDENRRADRDDAGGHVMHAERESARERSEPQVPNIARATKMHRQREHGHAQKRVQRVDFGNARVCPERSREGEEESCTDRDYNVVGDERHRCGGERGEKCRREVRALRHVADGNDRKEMRDEHVERKAGRMGDAEGLSGEGELTGVGGADGAIHRHRVNRERDYEDDRCAFHSNR